MPLSAVVAVTSIILIICDVSNAVDSTVWRGVWAEKKIANTCEQLRENRFLFQPMNSISNAGQYRPPTADRPPASAPLDASTYRNSTTGGPACYTPDADGNCACGDHPSPSRIGPDWGRARPAATTW